MSIYINDKSGATPQQTLVAGISPVDQILSGGSKNAIANKAVYNALKDKIDKAVQDLVYYYDKSQVYNKAEVRALIDTISTMDIRVVNALPTQDISTTTIYFLKQSGANAYDEYVYVDNAWVKIGDTQIDLSGYMLTADFNLAIADYYTKAEIDNLLNSYYTKTEIDTELNTKQDTLTFDTTPTAGSNNPVKSSGIYNTAADIYEAMGKNGAKNYFQSTAVDVGTHGGVTMVRNNDGSFSFSGTCSSETGFSLGAPIQKEDWAGYILSGCPVGGGASTFYLRRRITTSSGVFIRHDCDYGQGVVLTALDTDEYGTISVVIKTGQVMDGVTISPMVRLPQDTDSTYQPYALTNQQITEQIEQIAPAAQNISNPNLLDNPWFTVNQRGESTYTAYGYTFDRWHNNSTSNYISVSEDTNGMHLVQTASSSNGFLRQIFETPLPAGIYTLSADVVSISGRFIIQCQYDDSSYSVFPTFSTTGITSRTIDTGTKKITRIFFQTYIGTDAVIRAVKLERGTVCTLANDMAPNYVTELLKCQRYQYVVPFAIGQALSTGVSDGNGAVWFPFSLPTPLRTQSGKWSLLNGSLRTHGNGAEQTETDYAPIVPGANYDYYCYGNGNIVHMQAVSIQPMTAYTLDSDTGGTLLFDANL